MNDIPDERPNSAAEGTESTDNSAEKSVASADDLWLTLPCKDDKAMKALIVGREEGYYKAGLVYKEDLNDPSSAIQIWEKSLTALKDNDYTPLTYYQIYRTYWNIEQLGSGKIKSCATCNSTYWGNQIKQKYPGSEWARFVEDPNAKDENEVKKANELAGYEEVYQLYAKRYYPEAMTACNKVLREDSANHLLCKYKILRAVCVGYVDAMAGLTDQYQEALKEVIKDCPGSPEAEKAQELLMPFAPKTEKTAEATPAPVAEVNFQFDENAEHYFAIEIPLSTPNINGYKAIMADYTQKFYASNKLIVTGNMLNPETQLLMTKSFKKLADAQDFMSTFALNTNEVKEIHEKQFPSFLISKQNYVQLFKIKSLDSYKKFYQENYPK
jgi:tetratricopeptide (TPR) repeat protein